MFCMSVLIDNLFHFKVFKSLQENLEKRPQDSRWPNCNI